ncbi:enoyl-CoA hydratase/isomerase family protein [Desulforhopalus singaporensis]|uniref:Enoyl-CoA hydratase n=1 Tax=Desulforhopalus singaporensis TaxID=91360 RepID=A0A1H0UFE0_9BACT|nr:enoyl-CoA hydratase-related protein [Desulforhopalus singaporensis]SDP64780.1 enoyl-CoA hydratase [Desulforhopalus singaporensis]
MKFENILLETSESTAIITLNRPKAMNAINSKLLAEIHEALDQVEADETIQALVITGGEKVFAAGADIKEIRGVENPTQAHRFLRSLLSCFNRLSEVEIPVIAAISGFAFGGGCELALCCDIRIASKTAQLALPEINLGLMPGAGGTQRLARLIGMGLACEMLFTGAPVSADRARKIGLVNKVVEEPDLVNEAMKMATVLGEKPGFALKMIKKAVKTGMNTDLVSGLDYESRCFELLFSTEDQKEGTSAFVEKRKPEFKGY